MRQNTDDNVIWRMGVAYWTPKAKNTDTKWVMHIIFPLQGLLHERASMLRYTYMASIFSFQFF